MAEQITYPDQSSSFFRGYDCGIIHGLMICGAPIDRRVRMDNLDFVAAMVIDLGYVATFSEWITGVPEQDFYCWMRAEKLK